jgi:hypothetical protein
VGYSQIRDGDRTEAEGGYTAANILAGEDISDDESDEDEDTSPVAVA